MTHSRQIKITDFFNWDHSLNIAIKQFKQDFGEYPNIATANTTTFGQIDVVANIFEPDSIAAEGNPEVDEWGFKAVSGFGGNEYYVEFTKDESQEKNTLNLIFEENPEFE